MERNTSRLTGEKRGRGPSGRSSVESPAVCPGSGWVSGDSVAVGSVAVGSVAVGSVAVGSVAVGGAGGWREGEKNKIVSVMKEEEITEAISLLLVLESCCREEGELVNC